MKQLRPKQNGMPNPKYWSTLTANQIRFLRGLNQRAYELEISTREEMQVQTKALTERVNDAAEKFLSDFEIEAEFQFYLSPDFPGYTDDQEQIDSFWIGGEFLGDSENWNPFRINPDHPLSGEHFCYSMKQLIENLLGGKDGREQSKIFHVDAIWSDISVTLQRVRSVSKDGFTLESARAIPKAIPKNKLLPIPAKYQLRQVEIIGTRSDYAGE